jgi:hypothetical protein
MRAIPVLSCCNSLAGPAQNDTTTPFSQSLRATHFAKDVTEPAVLVLTFHSSVHSPPARSLLRAVGHCTITTIVTVQETKKGFSPKQKPINQLTVVEQFNILLSLTDGGVFVHDLRNFRERDKLEKAKGTC